MDGSLPEAGNPHSVGHHSVLAITLWLVNRTAFPLAKAFNGIQEHAADEQGVFTIRPNTPEARLKPPAGRLSLFDAVPF
jgi:hypothetical protein